MEFFPYMHSIMMSACKEMGWGFGLLPTGWTRVIGGRTVDVIAVLKG